MRPLQMGKTGWKTSVPRQVTSTKSATVRRSIQGLRLVPWSINATDGNNNDTVTYDYGTGGTYTWAVFTEKEN